MKKFCVVTNHLKDKQLMTAHAISDYIHSGGGSCEIVENMDTKTGEFKILSAKDIPDGHGMYY